jgi:hypothetical protein
MRAGHALALAKGAATYVPFAYSMLGQKRMMTAGVTAQYCYGVWLKHILLVDEISHCEFPKVVAELGPGDTIGVGIAALLSGATRYVGIDARRFVDTDASISIAKELIALFSARTPFPASGWCEIRHLLDEHSFPSKLLDKPFREELLSERRANVILSEIGRALSGEKTSMITYSAPVSDPTIVDDNSVDLLISQSVLEHVVDLRLTLLNTFRWLKPGGFASHQFDLTSHDIVSGWDEHRLFGERAWSLVVGKRPFMINRLPYSAIVDTFESCGFRIVRADRLRAPSTISRAHLTESWRAASDDDLVTYGGYVIAQKPD